MYNYHQELIKNSRNNSVEPSNKKQVQQQKKFNIKNIAHVLILVFDNYVEGIKETLLKGVVAKVYTVLNIE